MCWSWCRGSKGNYLKYKEVQTVDRNDWLKWRHTGVGSSDAGAIIGVSRFRTREQLLEDKVKPLAPEDQTNYYVKKVGNEIEARIRSFLEYHKNTPFQPTNCESTEFPFRKASLDGANPDRRVIVEIKLLTIFNPGKPNTKTEGYQKWLAANDGVMPEEYIPQVQHQLDITGAEVCLFVGYRQVRGKLDVEWEDIAIIRVEPNKEYMTKLAQEEFKFWYTVTNLREERDVREITEPVKSTGS